MMEHSPKILASEEKATTTRTTSSGRDWNQGMLQVDDAWNVALCNSTGCTGPQELEVVEWMGIYSGFGRQRS